MRQRIKGRIVRREGAETVVHLDAPIEGLHYVIFSWGTTPPLGEVVPAVLGRHVDLEVDTWYEGPSSIYVKEILP